MAKMTNAQAKRAYRAIKQKARRLWEWTAATDKGPLTMSTQDMIAIEKICDKYLKKF